VKLRDLLPESIRDLNKEAIDLPPQIHFSIPQSAHHSTATKPSTPSFYQNKDINFKTSKNMKDFKVTDDFVDYVKTMENAQRVGYNKKSGLWMPHRSPEGGMDTVGYGHKLDHSDARRLSGGITDSQAEKLLQNDLEDAARTVKSHISSHFGDVKLSDEQMEMLVEFTFNLGGLKKFPKFTKAVVNKDWDTAKKEYKRSYVDSAGSRHELSRRNIAFYNRYLSDKVD